MSAGAVHLDRGLPLPNHADLPDLPAQNDDHTIYAKLVGRSGGQDLAGGTLTGEALALRGTTHVQRGDINVKSRLLFGAIHWDANPTRSNEGLIEFADTFTTTASFTTQVIKASYVQNRNAGGGNFFLRDDSQVVIGSAESGFSTLNFASVANVFTVTAAANHIPVYTLFNFTSQFVNTVGAAAVQTGLIRGLNFAPRITATGAFDVHDANGVTAFHLAPTWSSGAGAAVDFGDVVGFDANTPKLAFGGSNAGTKRINSYSAFILRDKDATLTLDGTWVGMLSELGVSVGKHYMFRNTGGAASSFGLGSTLFGSVGVGTEQAQIAWVDASKTLYIGTTLVEAMGVHIATTKFSVGVTVPNPATATVSFFTVDPPSQTAGVGGDFIVNNFRSPSVNNAGFALDNVTLLNLTPPSSSGGGSQNDTSAITIGANAASGSSGNQGIFMRVGSRFRSDGIMNRGSVAVAQLVADANDYALPTLLNKRPILRISSDATRIVSGINANFPGVQTGDEITFLNVGSFNILFTHEDTNSSAANRLSFANGGTQVISPGEAITFARDGVLTRWRVMERANKPTLTIERAWDNPTASDDKTFRWTPVAITVTAVLGVINGGASTPSVTVSILHSTDRSAAGNQAVNAQAVTSVTTGDSLTLGGDVTIPAGSWIWAETSGQVGTTPELALTITYTED